jgi:predicted O-methyltransferase YrrM
MSEAVACADKFVHLKHAAGLVKEGLILEFGVYKGLTTNHLAKLLPDRTIYGFDSFRGLPEKWSGYRHSEVNFDKGGVKPKVLPNVELVAGWFNETIPLFIEKNAQKIGLLHIDCDIYSSTVTIFDALEPFIVTDTVIVFDEFFNYPGYENHEFQAFFEFVEKYGISYKFISYAGQQAGVIITSKS